MFLLMTKIAARARETTPAIIKIRTGVPSLLLVFVGLVLGIEVGVGVGVDVGVGVGVGVGSGLVVGVRSIG